MIKIHESKLVPKPSHVETSASKVLAERDASAYIAECAVQLCLNDSYMLALDLLKRAQKLTSLPFECVLKTLAKQNKHDQMFAFFSILRRNKILPSHSTFRAVMKALASIPDSRNGERLDFIFIDLKTHYFPKNIDYELVWKSKLRSHDARISPFTTPLWKEMVEAGIHPTQIMFVSSLESLILSRLNFPQAVDYSSQLALITRHLRMAYGYSRHDIPHRKPKISDDIVKKWMEASLLIDGHEKALALAASVLHFPSQQCPKRNLFLRFELKATVLCLIDKPGANLFPEVKLIPSHLSAFDLLIQKMYQHHTAPEFILEAWNSMTLAEQENITPKSAKIMLKILNDTDFKPFFNQFEKSWLKMPSVAIPMLERASSLKLFSNQRSL